MMMTNEERFSTILSELAKGEERMAAIETKLGVLEKNTQGVVTAFGAASGAFKTLEWIGKIAKPVMFLFGGTGLVTLLWFEVKRRLSTLL